MEATIEVSGLRKHFGPAIALDGMTFSVQPGQVTGFVGPNGAGKSTTIRVILGLDAPDDGSALIGGQRYQSLRHPLSRVGSLLDSAALQPSRTARNHLLWLAHSQGLTARRGDAVIEQAGLEKAARRKAGGYSQGMRQRLGIAAALLGDPPVLMFDEPFNGMDPEGIVWMRGFLRSLAGEGRAVLVSSHLMAELQDSADHLVVAGRGQVIADTTVAALIAAASGDRVSRRPTGRPEAMTALADAGATTAATGRETLTVSGLPAERIVAVLTGSGGPFSAGSAHRARRDGRRFVPPGQQRGGREMSTGTITPYRSGQRPGRDDFPHLLRAEWTKFRTVRGWVLAMVAAAVLTALAVVALAGVSSGSQNAGAHPTVAIGLGGEAVTDDFYFVHQSLDGNGSITARVASLDTELPTPTGSTFPHIAVPRAKAR